MTYSVKESGIWISATFGFAGGKVLLEAPLAFRNHSFAQSCNKIIDLPWYYLKLCHQYISLLCIWPALLAFSKQWIQYYYGLEFPGNPLLKTKPNAY